MTLKNTEKNVIIKITNIQSAEDMNEKTELITGGKFYKSNGRFYIFYSEEATAETSACKVMIIAEDGCVTIKRQGEFSSKMHYVQGKAEQITYHTPYGNMIFMLETLKTENKLTENGGELNLIYKLSVNGDIINNNLKISVKG